MVLEVGTVCAKGFEPVQPALDLNVRSVENAPKTIVLAGPPSLHPDTKHILRNVQENLDREISQFEVLAEVAKQRKAEAPALLTSFAGNGAPSAVQTNFNTPDRLALRAIEDESVPILDEMVIEGELIDPFDEEATLVVDDPWEAMNSRVFRFNLILDQVALKPIAMGYDWVMPDVLEEGISNAIQNIRFVPRFANNLFQAEFKGAGIEITRFLINSTLGIAGFIDVAELAFDLKGSDAHTGQTLALYNIQSGPYVVFPFLPPMTLRDGVGTLANIALDPLTYVFPFVQAGTLGGEIISERSQNLELFDGVQAGTVDLYGAVREAYFQRSALANKK